MQCRKTRNETFFNVFNAMMPLAVLYCNCCILLQLQWKIYFFFLLSIFLFYSILLILLVFCCVCACVWVCVLILLLVLDDTAHHMQQIKMMLLSWLVEFSLDGSPESNIYCNQGLLLLLLLMCVYEQVSK